MAGASVNVADNVSAVPALSYWSQTGKAVDGTTGVGKLCASEASLFDETPTANDIFAASMAESPLLCCPSANEITKAARSRRT